MGWPYTLIAICDMPVRVTVTGTCNGYIYYDYLCHMERKERIRRYEDGETITSIASKAGVSRQAIIRALQRAGLHVPGVGGRPAPRISERSPVVEPTAPKPVPTLTVFTDPGVVSKRTKVAHNVYKLPSGGYDVFDMSRGGQKVYKDYAEYCKVYG